MEAKLGGNKGTCQSIVSIFHCGVCSFVAGEQSPLSSTKLIFQLTFHTNDGSGNSDEQDIEIIGSKGADDGMPPAIELTNWNVSVSRSSRCLLFPCDY